MEITAYVEPIQNGTAFRARVAFPFALEATGVTKQEALIGADALGDTEKEVVGSGGRACG